jgi:hypothetical protein
VGKVDFVDKLIVKNYVHHEAIKTGMDYFNEHEEYTHLLLSSDDVLGTPEDVKMLIEDVKEHGFPVVTGWNNTAHKEDHSNITVERVRVVDEKLEKITERFRPSKVYPYISIVDVVSGKHGYPFIKAWYAGFPLALIQRKVLMDAPFRPFLLQKDRLCNTPETKAKGRGTGYDLQFSIDCLKNNVPLMVDTRVFLLHFGKTKSLINIGREKPSVTLTRKGEAMPHREIYVYVSPTPVKAELIQTPELIQMNPVVIKWSERIEINKSIGQLWHKGFPYTWWKGKSSNTFLNLLPEHLDEEIEPLWFK